MGLGLNSGSAICKLCALAKLCKLSEAKVLDLSNRNDSHHPNQLSTQGFHQQGIRC